MTDANPQQKDFLWTSGVRLVDYTSTRGEKLQAALWLPANYEAGKKYPTLVYIYEKLSQMRQQLSAAGIQRLQHRRITPATVTRCWSRISFIR